MAVTAQQISALRNKQSKQSTKKIEPDTYTRRFTSNDIASIRQREYERKQRQVAFTKAMDETIAPSNLSFPEQEIRNKININRIDQYNNSPQRYRDDAIKDKNYSKYVKIGANAKNPSLPSKGLDLRLTTLMGQQPFMSDIKNKATYAQGMKKQHEGRPNDSESSGVKQIKPEYMEMSKEEINTYNYYLGKYGEKKADIYLKALHETLKNRQAKGISDYMKKDSATSTINSITAGAQDAIMGFKQDYSRLKGNTNPVETSAIEQSMDYMQPQLKGKQELLSTMGYSMGNMIPSILVGTATGSPALGAAALGLGITGSTYNQERKKGKDDNRAIIYSTITGAFNAGLQYVLGGIGVLGKGGLSKFVTKTPTAKVALSKVDDVVRAVSKNPKVISAFQGAGGLALNMNDEGFEEYLQTALDPVIRNAVYDDEHNKFKVFSKDALYSYMVGALTAGMFDSPGSIAKYRNDVNTPSVENNSQINNSRIDIPSENMDDNTLNNDYETTNNDIEDITPQNMQRNELNNVPDRTTQNTSVNLSAPLSESKINNMDSNIPKGENQLKNEIKQSNAEINQPKTEIENKTDIQSSEQTNAMNVKANWNGIENATVKGISKVENGKARLSIVSDGQKVTDTLDNVEFDNPDVKQVYLASENYKTNGAKAFVSNFKEELTLPVYNKAFSSYYDAGVVNMPYEKVNSAYGTMLPEEVRLNAYHAGINDAKVTEPIIEQNKTFGVVESEFSNRMDADTKSALNELGKLSKTEIHIEESIAGGQANGMYKNGALYIALDSDNPYMTVAKHELTHAIKDASPELYKSYKDFVISEINKSDSKAYNDMVDRLLNRYSEIGQSITRDEAMDEIVADASEMFLTDPEAIEKLSKQDKTLGQKVLDHVKEIIKKIQSVLSSLEPKSAAAKALNENLDTAKKAEELWTKALADKVDKKNSTEEDSNAEEIEETEGITEDNQKEVDQKDTIELKADNGEKFQLKDVDPTEYNRVLHENYKLKEINSLLKEQFKITNELKPNRKQLERVSKDILKKANSSYSSEALTDNLENIWKFVQMNTDQMYTDDVIEATSSMAKMILKRSSITDNTLVENSKDMLDEIKKTPLMISAKDRPDLASEGGLNNFRRKYLGKIKLVASGGISVDTFYQNLCQKYPEYFSEDITHPAEQLVKIADTIDFIKPINYNPYGMNIDEAAQDLAYDIISSAYFDIKQASPTFADNKKTELEKVKMQYNKKVKELREGYRNKYNERLAEVKKENEAKIVDIQEKFKEKAKSASAEEKQAYKEKIDKLRDQNLQKLKAQQDRFTERMEMGRARRNRNIEANKYKDRIKKITKDLSDMLLKPSEKKHLPSGFNDAIRNVCQILDFDTGTLGPKGEPTQAALRWRKLQEAYSELGKNEEYDINSFYSEDMEADLAELGSVVEGKRVNQLNYEELEKVYNIMKHIKHIVSQENKMFSDNIKETTSDTAENIIVKLNAQKSYSQYEVVEKNKGLNFFSEMLTKGNIKPYYFFKQIGGEMERLYTNIRNGEDKFIANFKKGNEYAHDVEKRYQYHTWSGKNDKAEEFTTDKGIKISLTTGEKLYIYLAFKRKQGKNHILNGGIRAKEPKITTNKNKDHSVTLNKIQHQSEPVKFTENDIERLTATLTEEQKGFADEMGEYLTKELSELGNEVSNKLFGYDAFTEKNYIPLTSDPNFLTTKAGVTDDRRIKRSGFTKALTPQASNPIVAADLMDVWSKHLVDMSMYNSLVLPLEDFQRVWNYTRKIKNGEIVSVKTSLQKAYGAKANEYIKNLLNNINGGIKPDTGGELSNLLISKMKVDAVMGNLSVAIQQPSSLARAFVIIDPKYFGKTLFNKRDYEELLRYSPQAVLKQYGYFDVNMGRSLQDVITEQDYDTPIDKMKAFFTDKNVRDEVFSWLPQKMDELTWSHIWNAVKEETKDKTKLKEGTPEFYEHVKNRFKEVIDRSQVMDSVFQRSEIMRSQNSLAKIATNFMAEPTVNYNMLYDAINEYKKKGASAKPYVTRVVASVISASILNGVLKSIITAGRDKDEDKNYYEKYLKSFIKNVSDDPVSMIPIVNSAVSCLKGYDVIRPDMQLFKNLYYAGKKMVNDKYTPAQKTLQMAQAIAPFFNIPLKNVSRDIEMVWRNSSDMLKKMGFVESKDTEFEKLQDEYGVEIKENKSTKPTDYSRLYQAQKNKDTKTYKEIYRKLISEGKKPSAIQSNLNQRRREEIKENPSLIQMAIAKEKKNYNKFNTARKELIDQGYKVDEINSALESIERDKLKSNAPTAEEFIQVYKTGDKSKWQPIFKKMRASGWSQKDLLQLVK